MNKDNGYNPYPDEESSYDEEQKNTEPEDIYPDDSSWDTQEENESLCRENKALQKQMNQSDADLKRLQKKIRKLKWGVDGLGKKHHRKPKKTPSPDPADGIVKALPLNKGRLQGTHCNQILFYKPNIIIDPNIAMEFLMEGMDENDD